MSRNDQNLSRNAQKRPTITCKAQSCPKWPRIDPNVQICPEWTTFVQNAIWWWNWKSTMMIKVKGNLVSSSARPICSSSSHSHLKWPLLLTLQYMSRNTNTKTHKYKYNSYKSKVTTTTHSHCITVQYSSTLSILAFRGVRYGSILNIRLHRIFSHFNLYLYVCVYL